jgi:hypothetical protein
MTAGKHVSRLLTAAFILAAAPAALAADDGTWTVGKSSGEVWFTSTGAQAASLKPEEILKPGDTVRTGRTGRVLLQRGEETILISPNSVVGLPTEKKEGLATTIVQQAGSILLEVEKRNVKHFEVETPYLAAVVKGTQFRVTVGPASTHVDVIRGQVEVADFKTGQIAQVMPGQHATTFAMGKGGLELGGSGTFNPIEQGKPRVPSFERIQVPKTGLTAPRNAANTSTQPQQQVSTATAKSGVTRISSSLGEVRLNFHRVTHGLAREGSSASGAARNAANKDTIWSGSSSGTTSVATGNSQSTSSNVAASSTSAVSSTGAAGSVSVSTTVSAVIASGTSGGTVTSGTGSTGTGTSGTGSTGTGSTGTGSTGTGTTGTGTGSTGNNDNDNDGNNGNHGHHSGYRGYKYGNNNDNNGNNGNNGNGNGHGRGH